MSSKCHLAISAILVAGLPSLAHADDAQFWISATARGPVAGRVELGIETVERFGDGAGGGLYESENIAVLGYRIDHVLVAAGYVRDIVYHGGRATIEQRARQEITFDRLASIGPLVIDARLRAEERWRDGSYGTGTRLRPFVRLALPLAAGLRLLATHESFVNLGAGAGQRGGYDRARNFLGIAVPLGRKLGAEMGYLNQWTRKSGTVGAAAFTLAWRW